MSRLAPLVPHHHGTVKSRDRTAIFWQSWLPGSYPKAALLFVHGLAEHSGRYRLPIEYLTPLGYACYGLDLRGHGQSEGLRVHVHSFDDYLADIAAVLREIRERHPGLPIALVGHSMGGLVAIRFALAEPHQINAVVISSPALAVHPNGAPPRHLVRIARLLSLLWPTCLFPSRLDSSGISKDPDVVKAYDEDPQVSRKVSARWYTSCLAAQREAFGRAGLLRLPMLLMQSGADRLVDPQATQRFADLAPPELVSFYTWPGLFHEMFNEPERLRVFQLVESWLDNWLAPT
jgi:alpha-beta hydrolase superfamily lysophospholipase